MGFLKSFLGAAAANAMRDSQKEKERLDKWNNLFDECLDMDIQFNDYLTRLGIKDSYSQRAGIYDEGKTAINAERRKIEQYKKKIEEFISLGGHPENIWYIDKLDDYIAKLKYMISIGYLEQQDQWIQADMEMLKTILGIDVQAQKIMREAREKEAEQKQREELVRTVGFDVDTLSGVEFEAVCQTIIEKMGFTTETTKTTGDGGIDIIAFNSQPLLSGKYIIQCKRYTGSVGEPIIRDLYGVVTSERANKGILMTTGYFTRQAIAFAEGKPIELIDGAKLHELLKQYGEPEYIYKASNTSINDAPTKKKLNIPPEYEWLREELEREPDWYSNNGNNVDLSLFITRYKQFNYWMNIAKDSPDNLKAKCRAIEILHDAIATRLRMGTRTLEEIYAAANLLRTLVLSIKKEVYKTSDNEKIQYLYYISSIIEGETCFWMGQPDVAMKNWMEVLENFKFLDNCSNVSKLTKYILLLSIWSCMNYLEIDEERVKFCEKQKTTIDKLSADYREKIDKEIDLNDEFAVDQREFVKKRYDMLMNPEKARYIITTSLTSIDESNEDSILLCEGDNSIFIREGWLSIVSFSHVRFNENKDIYFLSDEEDENKKTLLFKGNV